MRVLLTLLLAVTVGQAQAPERISSAMRGPWIITRQLTGESLGCFDPTHAHGLVGLHFTLGESTLLWNGHDSNNLSPQSRRVSGYEFEARYGQKPHDLGIQGDPILITQVIPTYGIPVNILLLRDRETLLIDACNIWLEATREDKGAE